MSPVCFVTEVLSTLRSSAPRARKPCPQSSALRLCRPPLTLRPFHSASLHCKGGETPQLAVATPRLRQVAFGMYVTCHCHNNGNNKGATTMTPKKNNVGFQTLALTDIHESTTNPRRTFDESKLAELAESVRT